MIARDKLAESEGRSQAVEIISKCDTKENNGSCVCACEGIVASLTQKEVD